MGENTLFSGAILVCPMLFVSRDLFPPWIVVEIFKHVLAPLLPLWPIAPNKDLHDSCNEDPQMRLFNNDPLGTGYQLAFASGDWMKSKIPDYDTPSLIFHGGADIV